ncbi:hypothetical protein KIN20_032297 [Parelaphostrongylus tenuis]|uniref:Uncharacterized protein n=1 Tax=Parelaphostrongylus tenuis TaxID=148309 RepID=A0AAD5R6E8_PARTN|nr:hypothetical protein KIN20_032297 [Parelaphostrongylus tenuis]
MSDRTLARDLKLCNTERRKHSHHYTIAYVLQTKILRHAYHLIELFKYFKIQR